MKICYIAHAIGGDVENNLEDLKRIIRKINIEQPDVVPFAPYFSDVVSLNDNIPEERERGFKNNFKILSSGVVDELWLTGNRISNGMEAEKLHAEIMGIPVMDYTNKL